MLQTHCKAILSLLLVVAALSAHTYSQTKRGKRTSKEPCPDEKTYTGKYRNVVYGFSILIPAGLKGYWNSARCEPDGKIGCVCMGDHGRLIPLGNDAVIEAFVGYQMEPEWSAADHEKSELASLKDHSDLKELTITSSKRFRLGRLNGRRYVVEYMRNDKKLLRDHIIALHKGVEYELILSTTTGRYQSDKVTFEKVIASWRLTPRG